MKGAILIMFVFHRALNLSNLRVLLVFAVLTLVLRATLVVIVLFLFGAVALALLVRLLMVIVLFCAILLIFFLTKSSGHVIGLNPFCFLSLAF